MMKITVIWRFIVGIDISKDTLDVYSHDRKTQTGSGKQFPNTPKGFEQLAGWLSSRGADRSQTRLISEHMGRYGEHLLRWTTDNGWDHSVVKTTALQQVGDEHHRKTDEVDAEGLAEYGDRFSDRLSQSKAPKPVVGQLKRLQAERRKMVSHRAALKSKLTEAGLHDADMQQLIGMWTQQVEMLSAHIDQLEDRIQSLLTEDLALARRHRQMHTAPGMGKVLTPLWVSLHAGQQTLYPRRVSSRFGFAPHPHQSGSSVQRRNRSTGFGNSEVRKVMHQAALSVVQNYPHYRQYYQRKEAEGKPHLVIINNVINKLIHLYCAMWNNQVEYDPNYIQKMKEQKNVA